MKRSNARERDCPSSSGDVVHVFMQWCSLAFCSEYTVLFSPPSLIRTHPRATPHGTTTLTNA